MKISNITKIELTEEELDNLANAAETLRSIYNGLSEFNLSVGRFNTEDIMRLTLDIETLQNGLSNYYDEDSEEFQKVRTKNVY